MLLRANYLLTSFDVNRLDNQRSSHHRSIKSRTKQERSKAGHRGEISQGPNNHDLKRSS